MNRINAHLAVLCIYKCIVVPGGLRGRSVCVEVKKLRFDSHSSHTKSFYSES